MTSQYDYTAIGRLDTITQSRGETLLANYQYAYDLTGNRVQAVETVRQLVQGAGTPTSQFSAMEEGYQAIHLGWPELGAGGYTLERSTDGVNWQPIATLDANTQRYIDEGLARHTPYWYRLTPDNGQGTPITLATETGYDTVTYTVEEEWVEGELVETVIDYEYDDLYRLTEANYSDGTFYHYAYDANGARQLTDSSGVITLNRSYSPYGETIASNGTRITSYTFTGEWGTGDLLHLRARMYSLTTARFLTRDSWQGNYKTPISYNYWLYGYSNPVKYVDLTCPH